MNFVFITKSLFLRVVSLSYINEVILLEMDYNNKKIIVSVIYHPRAKMLKNLIHFSLTFFIFQKLLNEINSRKPSLSIITGDLNGKSSHWWFKNINTQNDQNYFQKLPQMISLNQ